MSPFEHPLALVLIVGGIFLTVAIVVWDHHQTPARTGGDREPSSVRGATDDLCHGCEQVAPVQMYRGRRLCRQCAEEVSALDQMAFEQAHREDFRRWEASS